MRLSDILSVDRTRVVTQAGARLDKPGALRQLAELLARDLPVDPERLTQLLEQRERLQSTGIGDGVAIPHTALDEVPRHMAALLLCPKGIPFDSVDGLPVGIVFGVVGPKRMAGEHLKTLARVSRLLRSEETRQGLLAVSDPRAAYAYVEERDRALG